MGSQHWLVSAIALVTALNAMALSESEYSIESYDKSPGIYYESKGTAILFNVVWKIIVYVDLNEIDKETMALKQYVHHVELLCQTSIIRNWTGCAHFNEDANDRLGQISKTEMLLKEVTGQTGGSKRKRRGCLTL
jgi:hypothetical protein